MDHISETKKELEERILTGQFYSLQYHAACRFPQTFLTATMSGEARSNSCFK